MYVRRVCVCVCMWVCVWGVIAWVGVGVIAWVRKRVCGWYSFNYCCKVCMYVGEGGREECGCGCDCVGGWV